MLDRAVFEKEISEASSRITAAVMGLLLEKISPEGIVFGLLRTAASIAKRTYCSRDNFLRLAGIAFDMVKEDKPN